MSTNEDGVQSPEQSRTVTSMPNTHLPFAAPSLYCTSNIILLYVYLIVSFYYYGGESQFLNITHVSPMLSVFHPF